MADLQIRITSDSSAARDDIDGLSDLMGRAALPAAAAGAAIAAMGADAVSAASDAEQAAGALEATFGDAAAAMTANAEAAAQNVGLSEAAYSQMASVIGSQLGNMGVAQADVGSTTDELIAKGADLAAQFGGSTADAVAALSSLMRGERDPIEKYGVSINAAAVEAEKARQGLDGLTGEADRAATTQATLALLNEQTATSAGAFARETTTAAGAQQIASASWENAQATLGTALLPAVSAAAAAFAAFAGWVQNNSTLVLVLVGIVAVLAGGVLAFNAALAISRAAIGIATAAQWAWNAAMSANPLGIILIAILAVIAVIVLLVQNWDTVKATALAVWEAISAAVGTAAEWLQSTWDAAITAVLDWFTGLGDSIRNTVDNIIGWFADIPGKIMGFFNNIQIPGWITDALGFLGLSAPVAALTLAAPTTYAAGLPGGFSSALSRTPGNTTDTAPSVQLTVNFNGLVTDPEGVAREIRRILDESDDLNGRR